jgi:hypothetical protein
MSLSESDGHAISTAIRILSEAGYRVEKVGQGSPTDNGVAFRLEVNAPTSVPGFDKESEAAKDAVMETPEFGWDGEPVQEDEDD